MDKLFPGISEELIAADALSSDIIGESRWFMEGAYHCRFQSSLVGLLMSWHFLEGFVQRASSGPSAKDCFPLFRHFAGSGREHWDKNSLKPRLRLSRVQQQHGIGTAGGR